MLRIIHFQRSFCQKAAKPFESLPGPKLFPFFGSFFESMKKYKLDQFHLIAKDNVKNYGKIYYDKLFNFKMLSIADPKTTAAMFRNEGFILIFL